jgi:hypothetical protein
MQLFGIRFGEGTSKVGEALTFSLPSRETCPGASTWCLRYCYAQRYERLRPNCRGSYAANLRLAQDPEGFADRMIGVLPRITPFFRLHVSGDFFSAAYAAAWVRICESFPNTRFWSYTRSWAAKELLGPLEQLRDLPNVQLLASCDPTMPLPPEGWRVAFVSTDSRSTGPLCGHQAGTQENCLVCGYCLKRHHGHVIFGVR